MGLYEHSYFQHKQRTPAKLERDWPAALEVKEYSKAKIVFLCSVSRSDCYCKQDCRFCSKFHRAAHD